MLVDPKRVQAVFLAATEEKDIAARATFLDRECAADAGLRLRVEALLRAHDQPESQLDDLVASHSSLDAGDSTEADDVRPPADGGDATLDQTPPPEVTEPPAPRPITEGPGTRIGPYKVREKIGEGGHGRRLPGRAGEAGPA
jgi:eukaryotic-like serine/threonine-protein kinase